MLERGGQPAYRHGSPSRVGVLLVNLGTPRSASTGDVRRYLKEFLWDPRVVEMTRPLWWVILNGVILNLRPRRTAAAYRKVWTDQGSPLLAISKRQALAVAEKLERRFDEHVALALAMRYGEPSVAAGLQELHAAHAERILVLPLYPQYSATTTAAVFDAVADEFRHWRWLPDFQFITSYHDFDAYIEALADSVSAHWQQNGRGQRLLFSFHGIPTRYIEHGDPYACHCRKTARLVATRLQLDDDAWSVCFQSRFGREEWLKPYTDVTLVELPQQGVRHVDVICPGFAADCLETLEEMDIQNRQLYLDAGGDKFQYIPCLNDSAVHIDALSALLATRIDGWADSARGMTAATEQQRVRAIAQGAPR